MVVTELRGSDGTGHVVVRLLTPPVKGVHLRWWLAACGTLPLVELWPACGGRGLIMEIKLPCAIP